MFETIKEDYSGLSLALGFFDGVHLGHQKVIANAIEYAKNNKKKSAIITFNNHPALYFGKKIDYITSIANRNKLLKETGIDYIFCLDFSTETLNTTWEEYLTQLTQKFSPSAITTGFNHTFGKSGLGTPETLEKSQAKYGFKYFQIPATKINDEIISSTNIRNKLLSGDIIGANSMLGKDFSISGKIISGNKIGRTIGFPTANIPYPSELVKIPYGVYKVNIIIDNKTFNAIMNFGIKPTINKTPETAIAEVHIPEFDEDIYNKNVQIYIKKLIRLEQKFESLEELKKQIREDLQACYE